MDGGLLTMKALLGILCLDRPKTTNECIVRLLGSDERDDLTIVVVDNGSNEETQEMLRHHEKEVDLIIRHEWNVGCAFGVNTWMSLREEGQTCIQVDLDMLMYSPDWWTISKIILQDEDVGVVAPRRSTAWIDRPDKRDFYRNHIRIEQRHDLWLEVPDNNLILTPMMIYKGNLLDTIGFENEATGYDDLDFSYRVRAMGLKSMYIPYIFLRQSLIPEEECHHPQRGAHRELMTRTAPLHQEMVNRYLQGKNLYCGTRFLPLTMTDSEYTRASNLNWEFHRSWPDVIS